MVDRHAGMPWEHGHCRPWSGQGQLESECKRMRSSFVDFFLFALDSCARKNACLNGFWQYVMCRPCMGVCPGKHGELFDLKN